MRRRIAQVLGFALFVFLALPMYGQNVCPCDYQARDAGGNAITASGGRTLTWSWSVTPAGPQLANDDTDTLTVVTFNVAGTYDLQASFDDGRTQKSSPAFTVIVNEYLEPSDPFITGPNDVENLASASVVGGNSVLLEAMATDNIGVSGVQFILDGQDLGMEVLSPEIGTNAYRFQWDSRMTPHGLHWLTARARDAAMNSATATSVPLIVWNP